MLFLKSSTFRTIKELPEVLINLGCYCNISSVEYVSSMNYISKVYYFICVYI